MDALDKKFESAISSLSDKEKNFFRTVKNWVLQIYNGVLKPILWAIFMFWIFTKVKNAVGLQEAIYVQLTVIIIFLRLIASRLV